ncbi:MAG: DUF115 domain-containing protein [Treponema sp.]|nr:DUF115 domain-containing protein [Treponema sp.]
MAENDFFEKNIGALGDRRRDLRASLERARALGLDRKFYSFIETPVFGAVPALASEAGPARALHSTVNPQREAERLIGRGPDGFAVFLGLGGGFAVEAALNISGAAFAIAIEFGAAGLAELFSARDYSGLLRDPRFELLLDPDDEQIESAIARRYLPAIYGGIKVFPLRPRIAPDPGPFERASNAAMRAIEAVSADYSAQTHFGMRWFSNIIRNALEARMDTVPASFLGASEIAICAAGPSLDEQAPLILARQKSRGEGGALVICADTALPALLAHGIKPDAAVSIDCQHASCLHFMGSACRDIPLFMDISSPPELRGLSDFPFFFCGGHPLAAYLRMKWASLPAVDTSGGNVTYACLSLAHTLGARNIAIYGADFSYPGGRIYARGSYVFSLFESRQTRLSPLEAQAGAFLFRNLFLHDDDPAESGGKRRYETAILRSYRISLARKVAQIAARPQRALEFLGKRSRDSSRPFSFEARPFSPAREGFRFFPPTLSGADFLRGYLRALESLRLPEGPPKFAREEDGLVFETLLPFMAALRSRRPALSGARLAEESRRMCADKIAKALG